MQQLHRIYHRCCQGCCNWRRHSNAESRTPLASYLHIFGAKFLLEVMGAAGAVWGTSEIFFLRDTSEGTEAMRLVAMLVGVVFLIRYYWCMKHWWQHERDYLPTKIKHRRTHRISFFQIHASKFVLHVLGGAGAIWGAAEALTLRDASNAMQWRFAATFVGALFLIRWSFQILAYCLYLAALWSNPSSMHMTIIRWCDAFIAKLILEVFGAAGAVWGCSEILTLRSPDTNRLWRPTSILVGAVFLVRWLLYLPKFVQSERAKSQMQVDETHSEEVEDLEAVSDLQLKESASMDAFEEETMELHTSMEVGPPLDDMVPSPTSANPLTPLKREKKQLINGDTFT